MMIEAFCKCPGRHGGLRLNAVPDEAVLPGNPKNWRCLSCKSTYSVVAPVVVA